METPNIRKLRYYLATNYKGEFNHTNVHQIESNLQIRGIKLCVESLPRLFWICKHTSDRWNIRMKINVKFCIQYQNGHCNGDCKYLHLCKYFVISDKFCQGSCKFGFSHDICDQHNDKIWKLVSPELFTIEPNLKLHLVRNSFPRVCSDIIKDGKCSDLFCGRLHICSRYVFGVCTDCKFRKICEVDVHNLSSDHNKAVLNNFNLSDLESGRGILQANILLRKYLNENDNKPQVNPSIPIYQHQMCTLELCHNYLNSKCTQRSCNGLHICKEYLVNKCPIHTCKFGFSHDLLDKHNRVVIKTHGLQEHPPKILLKLIQSRFPWICSNYKMRKTCNDMLCKNMHICPKFADNNCDGNCYLSHDFKDIHNLKVLKSYLLDKTDNIATNILFSRFDRTTENTGIQNTTAVPNNTANERSIFLFIINSFQNGSCKLKKLLHFFNGDKAAAEIWFNDHLSSYRLVKNTKKEITVHICLSDVMPCNFYWSKDGCNFKVCKMFHVCKRLLQNIAHSSISCKHNHEIIDTQKKLVSEKRLDDLSETQLLTVLRYRYPYICQEYLGQHCKLTDTLCPKLHICFDFLRRKCMKEEGQCEYKHEDGLNGEQALRLIKEYHLHVKTFRYCIMYNDLDKQHIDSRQITEKCNIDVSSVESVTPTHKSSRRNVTGDLYTKIEMDFKNSLRRSVTVIKIEEVFNMEYVKYAAKKKTMSKKLADVVEKQLYHGVTAESVDIVCTQIFDSNLCGKNGTIYGLGRYFAVNAYYSHNFTKANTTNVRYMFLVDVLVGQYTTGTSMMQSPPPISMAKPYELYDSVVDDMAKPSIFVIFEEDQYYPRYIISYKMN